MLNWKKLFAVIGMISLIGFSIALYWTFLIAFFNGGTALIVIDRFGEAGFEFVMIPMFLVWGIYGFVYIIKK